MKIAIVSDSHDHRQELKAAIDDAVARGASEVLHCGDVVAAYTLKVSAVHDIPVHVIHGNNMGDLYMMGKMSANPDNSIEYHGQDADLEIAGKKIFMVHYPHYAQAMALTGDWDIVCCGHNHQPAIEHIKNIKGGETILLNPGSVAGLGNSATYILGDLTKNQFELIPVEVIT